MDEVVHTLRECIEEEAESVSDALLAVITCFVAMPSAEQSRSSTCLYNSLHSHRRRLAGWCAHTQRRESCVPGGGAGLR